MSDQSNDSPPLGLEIYKQGINDFVWEWIFALNGRPVQAEPPHVHVLTWVRSLCDSIENGIASQTQS